MKAPEIAAIENSPHLVRRDALVIGQMTRGGGGKLALLEGKTAIDGKATLYVCENFACQAPLVGADAAEKELTADS